MPKNPFKRLMNCTNCGRDTYNREGVCDGCLYEEDRQEAEERVIGRTVGFHRNHDNDPSKEVDCDEEN